MAENKKVLVAGSILFGPLIIVQIKTQKVF